VDYDRLVSRHKDSVYRQMVRVCGNHDDAEDVLVDALVSAHQSLGQLRDEESFRAWLAMIGRRVCFRIKRREALIPLLRLSELPTEVGGSGDPAAEAEMTQMKACVAAAIESLPELYREVYVRRELDEQPAEEVAQQLNLSVPAVKSRLHRARKMVREHLDQSLGSDFESFASFT
jgi:RNA polymerase sigma-70 factor, ECF subfamily